MYMVRVEDFYQWRESSRALLAREIKPEDINWEYDQQEALAFEDEGQYLSRKITNPTPRISKQFMDYAEAASCFRCPSRWALLYSLAWRLVYENSHLMTASIDPQVNQLHKMCKAVWRDRHKMEAFVRFQRVQFADSPPDKMQAEELLGHDDKWAADNVEHYVAWFEPEHLILPISTQFFVKRFTNMSWSILTPDGCAHWDQKDLVVTEGIAERPQINDSIESLWLTYYSHIFNPARLKLKAMQSEMPKKYWVNLPEAPLINELTRNAGFRVDQMLENKRSEKQQKATKSRYVQDFQQRSRQN